MQPIVFILITMLLASCSTISSNSGNTPLSVTPVVFDKPYGSNQPLTKTKTIYTDLSEKPLDATDIKAINTAISAGNRPDWAPQEEVLQETMRQGT